MLPNLTRSQVKNFTLKEGFCFWQVAVLVTASKNKI
jgi:hypothetical protein